MKEAHRFVQYVHITFYGEGYQKLEENPQIQRKRILLKLDELATNPEETTNVKKLINHPAAGFRLRIGNYRVLFDKEEVLKIIEVVDIGNAKTFIDDTPGTNY